MFDDMVLLISVVLLKDIATSRREQGRPVGKSPILREGLVRVLYTNESRRAPSFSAAFGGKTKKDSHVA